MINKINIIGRRAEQQRLASLLQSNQSEFAVVYGRRRVGKTFLIREFFKNKTCLFFHSTGLQDGALENQLNKFSESLSETFFNQAPLAIPNSWADAFKLLHQQIKDRKEKVVIFLDELPWMATKKSNLLQEIDYYWNHYWSSMTNIILIACGSSASWLIKKIIYNKGGLHNRTTCQIRLEPFDLSETKAYLEDRKIRLNKQHILSLYMVLGGIPYYLRYIKPGLSAEQNIQLLFFEKDSPLKNEFNMLFQSLFSDAEIYIELIKLIAKKREGISRTELKKLTHLSSAGGRLSNRLNDLCEAGFIEEFKPWKKKLGQYYKLIDEFSLFFLYWVETKSQKARENYWVHQSQTPAYYAWSGYAFEAICFKHINQIINALNIKAIELATWRHSVRKNKEEGAQIDLLLDRSDQAITLCEIKYTRTPYEMDKSEFKKIQNKIAVFNKITGNEKQIFLAIISVNGIKPTIYSEELVSQVVTLADLYDKKSK